MSGKLEIDGRRLIDHIEFTEEQSKIISDLAGRRIHSMNIVELPAKEVKDLAVGGLRIIAAPMCW